MHKNRLSTGIDGLDSILEGGLIEAQNALLRGPPGAGKTIFGLYFLSAGIEAGETSLYLNLGEPSEYVQRTAEDFDLHADAIHFVDLSPTQEQFATDEAYTLFESSEVEQPEFVTRLTEAIEEIEPDRVLLDPITEFRFLTTGDRQFRTQILGLLDYLKARGATVMLTSQASDEIPDDDLQFLTDTVINLELGADDRTVRVSKFRGSAYQSGAHSYAISSSGIEVWPKIRLTDGVKAVTGETLSSGIPELDELLHGGLTHGTVTFLSGPTGAGKTTTGLQFLKEAVADGKRAVLYEFEESVHTLLDRAEATNIPITSMVENGDLSIVEIKPDTHTVDEVGDMIRTAVTADGVDVVMIDGTAGFTQNLRGSTDDEASQDLVRIGRYLRSQGVTTIITHEIHSVTGSFKATEEGTSNLADTILFIRHVEYKGELRKVIGTLKMRTSDFGRSLRELEITEYGLKVGEPLPQLRGILTGTPDWGTESRDSGRNDGA